jgi:hypothetical protein
MFLAVRHLNREGFIEWDRGFDIVPIYPVQVPRLEPALGQVVHERIRENNIDVGSQNEAPTRAADTDILGDHLEKRQHLGVLQRLMHLWGHFDKSNVAETGFGPSKLILEARPVCRWVPLHDHELCAKTRAFALGAERAKQGLEANQRIAPVIVVA